MDPKRGKRRERERETSSPRGPRLSERRRSVRQADSGAGGEVLVSLSEWEPTFRTLKEIPNEIPALYPKIGWWGVGGEWVSTSFEFLKSVLEVRF